MGDFKYSVCSDNWWICSHNLHIEALLNETLYYLICSYIICYVNIIRLYVIYIVLPPFLWEQLKCLNFQNIIINFRNKYVHGFSILFKLYVNCISLCVQLCSQRFLTIWLHTEVRTWRWPALSEGQGYPHIHWRYSGGTSGTMWTGWTDSPGQPMK